MIDPGYISITKSIIVPLNPTKQMFAAMQDETPLFCRRSIDKSYYEVGMRTNHDWREVISEDQLVLKEFAQEKHASEYFEMMSFAYRYKEMLKIVQQDATKGGWL